MGKARPPRSTNSVRSVETEKWQRSWRASERRRSGGSLNRKNDAVLLLRELDWRIGGKFSGFAETLKVLSVLGVDQKDWRRRLNRLPGSIKSDDGILSDDEEAVRQMAFLIQNKRRSIERAAECTLGMLGLYRNLTWESAVKRCRKLWQQYRSERLVFAKTNSQHSSETLLIANPSAGYDELTDGTIVYFGDTLSVEDNAFWRRAIELGLVVEIKTGR